MPSGRLKKYYEDRGFGFLRPADGGDDIFFHVRDLGTNPDGLRPGDRLEYELGISPHTGREVAMNVVRSDV